METGWIATLTPCAWTECNGIGRRYKSGFGLTGIWSNVGPQSNYERIPAVMSEHSDLKYVGIVAAIIGGTVLLLGLAGVALTLSG